MEFKVGDRVRIRVSCMNNNGKEGVISEDDGSPIPYRVTLDDGGTEWKHPDNITKLEETSMKFKVGDKVKVSNSWEGHDGEIGQIVDINVYNEFTHEVRFESMGAECFREEELESVKEKDNYPTLKQEYRSLLEIQKELTTLEESMMSTVRHTRTEIARNEEELAELESKILEAAKQ